MRTMINTFLISGFFIITLQQSNAESFPSNFEIPVPAWGSNQTPIAWGDCIPVPITPMGMPQTNMPINNIPYPQTMQMPIPAPIYNTSNQPQYRLPPPPSTFLNSTATPQGATTQIQSNCNNQDDKLRTLQSRYDSAASASRNKIAELSQALEDAQNQMSDSQNIINTATTENTAQLKQIAELENQLKIVVAKSLDVQHQLKSKQTANTLKSAQDNETISSLKKKVSDLKNSNITLKTQLGTAEKNAGSQARMLTSLQQDSTKLSAIKSAYKERNDENMELKSKLSNLDNLYKTLQAQFEKTKNEASSQARKLNVLGQSTAELSALQSAYKERNDENSAFKNKLAVLEKEKTGLLAMLNSKKTASTLKGAQDSEIIAGLKKKLTAMENDNISLKTQIETATKGSSAQARKITALSQGAAELTAMQSAYKERNDENATLKKKLFDSDNENKTLKAQLSTATTNTGTQARKLTVLSQSVAELEALKSAYKERNNENANLKIKISNLENVQLTSKACSSKLTELQNKYATSEDQRKSLLAKIETLEATSSNQARKITALMITTSELDSLKSAYKDLNSKKVELNNKLEAATADSDKDGVLDSSDKCPSSPQGSEVNVQGCPNIEDADGDGVADKNDLCPTSTKDSIVNEFGCSLSENITLKGVNFQTGSARLTKNSLPIINAAATTLKQSPNINIEILGYTDNQGLALVNKKLSKRRANSVMIQLIKQGIEAGRLTANGYGEKNPVAGNDTEEGRATNRRVELKIRN